MAVDTVVMLVLFALSTCAFVDSFVEEEYAEGIMWFGFSVILFVLAVVSAVELGGGI